MLAILVAVFFVVEIALSNLIASIAFETGEGFASGGVCVQDVVVDLMAGDAEITLVPGGPEKLCRSGRSRHCGRVGGGRVIREKGQLYPARP